MTSDNRSRLLRLAIAANLAIVATGVALLFPATATALLGIYVVAVAIAAWKGGWEAGALATAISTIVLLLMFAASFDESHLLGFIAAAVTLTAIMEAAVPHRRAIPAPPKEEPPEFGKLAAVEPLPDERDRAAAKRRELARALERAAAAQLEEQREAARRAEQDAKVARLTPKNDRSNRG